MKFDVAKGRSDLDFDHDMASYGRFVRGTISGVVLLVVLFFGLAFSLL